MESRASRLDKDLIAELVLVADQLYWHYAPDWQQGGYPDLSKYTV